MEFFKLNTSNFPDNILKDYLKHYNFGTWVIDGINIIMPNEQYELFEYISKTESISYPFELYSKGFEEGYAIGISKTIFDNEKTLTEKLFSAIFTKASKMPAPFFAGDLIKKQAGYAESGVLHHGQDMGIAFKCWEIISESPLHYSEIWPKDGSVYKDRVWQIMKKWANGSTENSLPKKEKFCLSDLEILKVYSAHEIAEIFIFLKEFKLITLPINFAELGKLLKKDKDNINGFFNSEQDLFTEYIHFDTQGKRAYLNRLNKYILLFSNYPEIASLITTKIQKITKSFEK